jgi:hypothetical protein
MRPNHDHRPRAHHRLVPVAAAIAVVALTVGAPLALAKEGLEAQLDAPIARDTPGGTTLLVGATVTVPDEGTVHPVTGSPLYLKLTGPDRTTSSALARETGPMGHYEWRIAVPASGIAAVEVGMRGSSDLAIEIVGSAIVPGGISAATAQVAPPAAVAPTPAPRATVAVAPPAVAPAPAVEPAPAVAPAPASAAAPPATVLLAAAVVVAVAALAVSAVAVRRSRGGGHLGAPRAPGA